MTSNLIAFPWASSKTKKAANKLWKATIEHVIEQKLKTQMRMMIDCHQKVICETYGLKMQVGTGASNASQDYWANSSYVRRRAVDDPTIKQLKALDLGKEAPMHHDDQMLAIMLQQGALPQWCKGDCRLSFVINKKRC